MIRHSERRKNRAGQSVVEVALMAPWIFFLFVGVIDLGFWCYSLVSFENGTRAAGLYASTHPLPPSTTQNEVLGLQTQLQKVACAEMTYVINIPANCANVTVSIPVTTIYGGNTPDHVSFLVTAPVVPMIPLPGLLQAGNVSRRVEVAVLSR